MTFPLFTKILYKGAPNTPHTHTLHPIYVYPNKCSHPRTLIFYMINDRSACKVSSIHTSVLYHSGGEARALARTHNEEEKKCATIIASPTKSQHFQSHSIKWQIYFVAFFPVSFYLVLDASAAPRPFPSSMEYMRSGCVCAIGNATRGLCVDGFDFVAAHSINILCDCDYGLGAIRHVTFLWAAVRPLVFFFVNSAIRTKSRMKEMDEKR